MYVSGTQVEMTDLNGQIQLTFRTEGDIRDLQRRTVAFSDALVAPPQEEGGRGGPMGMMSKGPMGMCTEAMGLRAATVRGHPMVENLRDGARIVFQPQDPSDTAALRARLHLLAAELVSGSCPQSSVGLLGQAPQAPPYDQQDQWREQPPPHEQQQQQQR
jgi:hypothetical protein